MGLVSIRVTPTPDSPTAVDDFIVVNENEIFATGLPYETVVPLGSVWSYLDTGVDQGTAWRDLAFNDSTWPTGPGQLGYGDSDEATVVRFATNHKFATTYFRTEFQATGASQLHDLNLNILRDDAAAVYLNGVEVHRDDALPPDATYNTYTGDSGVNETDFSSFKIDVSLLVEGTNLLAVEVHQAAPTTSDMSFDLSLEADSGEVTLLAKGSQWKYLANGLNQHIAWRETDYDDGQWTLGTAQFGYGDGDEVTVVDYRFGEDSKIPTIYFRHTFNISDTARILRPLVNLVRDDGAAVYLNGIEIVRDNLAQGAMFGTLASGSPDHPQRVRSSTLQPVWNTSWDDRGRHKCIGCRSSPGNSNELGPVL